MTTAIDNKGYRKLLLRGMLGGSFGGFVFVATPILAHMQAFGQNWGSWIFISYLAVGLPYGLFLGGLVGTAIWFIHRHTATNLGPVNRDLIGTLIVMLVASGFWSAESKSESEPIV